LIELRNIRLHRHRFDAVRLGHVYCFRRGSFISYVIDHDVHATGCKQRDNRFADASRTSCNERNSIRQT
jgi:hypothetical protein